MKNRTWIVAVMMVASLAVMAGGLAAANAATARTEVRAAPLLPVTSSAFAGLDVTSPTLPVRLIFIHHSTGANWLTDGNGDLGLALRDNNYFVSDTNYGWGPPDQDVGDGTIGDHTDIPNWYSWFTGPHRDVYLAALYAETGQHASYSRLAQNPGGPNVIIMFKSCFPNSNLDGNPDDPPADQADNTSSLTVANAKRIYLDLLQYFATRPDKLFVVIAAPPLGSFDTDSTRAANARAFNNWLVNDWLTGYPYNNVAVFDFYTVLTSNGGDADTNDLGWSTGNHHRYRNGMIEHITHQGDNVSAYPSSSGDSHPSQAGNLKATGEFVPLLNIFYHRWQASASHKSALPLTPRNGESVTFTIAIRGLPVPLTATAYLTDLVPAGLAYIPGTLYASSGVITANAPTLGWSGVLTPARLITITYAATVVTTTRAPISNPSTLRVPGYQSLTLDAPIIANGYSVYLPIIARN